MTKTNRFPPFSKDATLGQLYSPAMDLRTQEEADEYFERLVQHGMAHGQTREKSEKVKLVNLGYWTGYYDAETADRVFRLFRCSHPVFGTTRPDAKTAFEAGVTIGKRARGEKQS